MKNSRREEIVKKVKEAGVVGAGGAGFPTHIKINCAAHTLIVNIAECEPLIWKDKEITRLFPERIVSGAQLTKQATGAKQVYFALKAKHREIAGILEHHLEPGMKIAPLEDYYPAGDEVLLAYDVTGAVIQEGTLPLSQGIIVLNAETLYNISYAMDAEPVTGKFLTVAGAVHEPVTVRVPVGVTLKDLFHHLGISPDDHLFFLDGVMMGTLVEDPGTPIAKTTSGVVLVPGDHPVVNVRKRTGEQDKRIIKSACDQCSYCTEYCPRYLIGHHVEPHRIMRSLSFSREQPKYPDYAKGCVACSLCTFFACPEALAPDTVMREARSRLEAENGKKMTAPRTPHPMREFRKVPSQRLIKRISLARYDHPARFSSLEMEPETVRIPLTQYGGGKPRILKKKGDRISRGELLASLEDSTIGAAVHASINGTITSIEKNTITIEQGT
jgi:Na+-translocating ferredoxin:NAD+ oxidoreductase RnfC subunit